MLHLHRERRTEQSGQVAGIRYMFHLHRESRRGQSGLGLSISDGEQQRDRENFEGEDDFEGDAFGEAVPSNCFLLLLFAYVN